ncbi:chaperonin [Blastopirellula marina DSM 3645]|uniref:Co-chaperonin GroES n=2 Tax=Pirellulaceae TaxID=2691357 RepID=A3ZRD5_9BACT|nr:chaperonin [Blastopirellula marina DSM 3645]
MPESWLASFNAQATFCAASIHAGGSERDSREKIDRDFAPCMEFNPKMKIVPLGDNLVVKRLDAEETTAGGIVLPTAAQEKPKQGRVLSVGDGRLLVDGKRAPHDVKEGDRVLFSSWAGTEIKVGDQELLIMSEAEILAVLE